MKERTSAESVAYTGHHFVSSISKIAALTVCALLLCVFGAQAQNTADVVGTVTDQSGGAVPNAKVTLLNVATNVSRSMQTGATGDYSFTLLPVGAYSVSVEATGFKKFQASNITLAAGDRARVDAPMQVGEQTTTVEVSATQAPLLQTDSATVGGLVSAEATQNLPLNGRNVITLVQMTPGATEGLQSSGGNGTRPDDRRQTSTVVANGQGDSENNFLLDGMDNNERSISTTIVKPSVDALEEVKVDTSLYPADTGRAGGAVISMITKSGTNKFHGAAFEFFRNDILDAKDVFNTGKQAELRQNQFGGSIGGPIRKDKTFFFMDYEREKVIRGSTQTAISPTPCELTGVGCPVAGAAGPGNFSDLIPVGQNCNVTPIAGCIFDPNNGNLAFPNNIIPQGEIDPIANNYAKLYAVVPGCTPANSPTPPGCQFISTPNLTHDFITADMRIDEHINDTDSVFARYTINNNNSMFPGAFPGVKVAGITVFGNGAGSAFGPAPTFPGSNYGRQQNIAVGWDHIFRSNLLLDLRAGVSRYVSLSSADNAGHPVNTLFGGPANLNLPNIKGTDGLAAFNFQTESYSSLGDQFALPTDYWDTDFQYAGALTWTKGAHTLKFGGGLIRRNWTRYQELGKGTFTFNHSQTQDVNQNGGNSFASMLLGITSGRSRNIALVGQYNRDWEVGTYAQDDWRVNHWLTLNLGLRYDVYTWFTEKHNSLSNFDPTDPGVLAGGKVLVAGQNGVNSAVNMPTQHNMFQPRFGFAASLAHSFVLRGGFGTSYYVGNSSGPSQMDNAPFSSNFSDFQKIGVAFPVPTEDPSTECLVAACGATDQPLGSGGLSVGDATQMRYTNPYVIMGNLTLEKAFGANVISIGWVGEPGRNLPRQIPDINIAAPPGPTQGKPGSCYVLNQPIQEPSTCQPFHAQLPDVGSIGLLESNGTASFNAGGVTFNRRSANGLTIQANYTYEAALANTPGTNACDACGYLPNNPRYDWGWNDFEVRHRIVGEINYELPFGKSMTGVMGQIAKGWQVNGIYSFESGVPFNADDNNNQTGLANTPDRPDMVKGSAPFHKSLNEWFDTSQFVLQPFGFPGSEHRNQIFSPPEKRFDFSLFKDFSIRENTTLQFRTEIFNLTNTPNFAAPNNQISAYQNGVGSPACGVVVNNTGACAGQSGGFGQITASNVLYSPREIQFALKLIF